MKDLTHSKSKDVASFLETVSRVPVKASQNPGRLIFALDATLSRAPTWDVASHIQNEMFESTSSLGGLHIQLCYYKGFRDFVAATWCEKSEQLHRLMANVRCAGGQTQIQRVLEHSLKQHQSEKIAALVFVGDAMEENPDRLCELAGQMGLKGIPAFVFQEGNDSNTRQVFKELARLSGGAYAPFDLSSADELKSLLGAVAVYAAGGRRALTQIKQNPATKLLSQQLKD